MSTRGSGLDPGRFPSLAQFAAGYLHQDFALDHQTPLGAVRAFLRDASTDERAQLRDDLQRFLAAAAVHPWAEVVTAFRRLGAAWHPRTRAELASLLRAGLADGHDTP
ncbi:MAG TPA: contact-dependent growth inhibition system immunity protein [Vicinamibacterales bacterium]|nr:contact-dependent growth inhibition system immunity protein [Vicinamibacterales bacterium]